MLSNYLKIALRNLKRYKVFSLINISGLAIGITCCLLIFLFVIDELSYDKYNENIDNLYKVGIKMQMGDQHGFSVTTANPMGPTLVEEYPEILASARTVRGINKLVSWKEGDKNFIENRVYYADQSLIEMFTIPLTRGEQNSALSEPNSIIVSETIADKIFGSADPIGQTLTFDSHTDYTVTGIFEDIPSNSHVHYDYLASYNTLEMSKQDSWLSDNLYTYLLLKEGTNPQELEQKFVQFIIKHVGPLVEQGLGLSLSDWEARGNMYRYFLEPVSDIHLKTLADDSIEPGGDIKYIYIFSMVAIFILIIACVNFMNLTTARSATRAKEIGMRKVMGAVKFQLIRQFLTESVVLSFIAMMISLILITILLPKFNLLIDKELNLSLLKWYMFPLLIGITAVIGIVSGLYSAIFFSSFGIISVLKGKFTKGGKNSWFRNSLVIFQFSISIAIFICTLVTASQMKYIQNKKLGFDKEQVLIIDRAYALGSKMNTFKDEIVKNDFILSASGTSSIPGRGTNGNVFQKPEAPPEELLHFRVIGSDYDYMNTLGFEMKEGRYFSKEFPSDSSKVLINEAAVKLIGYENPIGKILNRAGDDDSYEILGVVKDYHFESLHEDIVPLMMVAPGQYWIHYMAVKIKPSNLDKTMAYIDNKWNEFVDNQPFEYFFLDQDYDNLHKMEKRTSTIFRIFSILSIIIACLGLFGLASFSTQQRTKEIGIRKVMGASIKSIVLLLSKDFAIWVLISNIPAWFVAYYFMKKWLQSFAYHVDLSLTIFVFAGLIALSTALITVSYHVLKVASANPTKSLKYE